MNNDRLGVGTKVHMRKKHACGSFQWEIIRFGADVKIKCLGCERIIMIERPKFIKNIKKVIDTNE